MEGGREGEERGERCGGWKERAREINGGEGGKRVREKRQMALS